MNTYIAYHFSIQPAQPGVEILIAQLGELGFDSFQETENGLSGYIDSKNNYPEILNDVPLLHSDEFNISHTSEEIAPVNWNKEWEKNFSPVQIGMLCTVRAPFHKKTNTKFDIVIEPKMAFGTGHHATTYMMVQLLLNNNWKGKTVLDMGCGTGVLAILAEKLGAKKIDAVDIDNWSYQNTLENTVRNHCKKIDVYEGGANLLKGEKYTAIIANINRNILLEDMGQYVNSLETNGSLFLSGFYKADLRAIREICQYHGLSYKNHLERERWIAVKFVK